MNLAVFSFILWLADADFLRSTGKIYTVALVALVIWLTILFYLIRLEKKIKNIEDRLK
jgi:CcmD family protein